MNPRRPPAALLVLGAACVASACSSGAAGASAQSAATRPPGVAGSTAAAAPTPSVAPAQRSDIPEGVYRTQLTSADVQQLGLQDVGSAGIWTFTFERGTYQLDCAPLERRGVDCGGASSPASTITVEYGTVHGSAPTVWFVHDMKALSKKSGCIPGSAGTRGCGPDDGYHLDWHVDGDTLVFSNYVGLGAEASLPPLNNFTARPWRRLS